ncbi:MAG TPA: carboxypeptidase regulatory-like domain-containing protein [Terriglobales bacterium]|nr:carboxypeptidase regulatory-like domain-containing protein [Terriglobales bacterium]
MRSKLLKLIAVLAIFSVAFLPLAFAQETTGGISGTVTDPSGAAVPGSAVTLTDQATGAARKATSSAQGSFGFAQVPVGTYTITATKEGFKTMSQTNVSVHVSTVTTVPVHLEVGAATEVVTVEASALNLNTENGEVGNVMLSNQVSQLPLNGRNFIQLTTLVPGAAVGEAFDNKNKGLLAGVDISFSGAPADANQWRVNGANNNDLGSQRTILIYPSVDAIQEFKITRNSYGPEYGGAGGAQINLITKSGGNDFHGSAYYYGRNDKLNAENFFLGQQKANCVAGDPVCGKKNFLRRNDYGYTVGGPIKKDKLFFFWSEEWNKERRGQVRQAWIPTAAERGSISNGIPADWNDIANCPAGSGAPAVPNDPTTGNPFPNNTIPVNQLSPAGEAYISQVPLPNLTNVCGQNNWVSQVSIPLDWREENVRGDYNINSKTTLMINFTNDAWLNPTHAYEEGGLWGDQNWPAVSDTWSQPSKMMVAKLTSTIGGNKINEVSFAWSANRINITQSGDNPQLQQQIVSAMPLIFPQNGKTHANQLPEQICWCSSYIGTIGPWNNRQDLYTWKDDFSWVKGSHTFKLGALYDRNGKDEETGEEAGGLWGGAGYLVPGDSAASLQGPGFSWSSPTGNMWSDAVLQGTLWGANENSNNPISLARWRDTEFYFGDTWKMSKTLTVDYGVRYSLIPNAYQEGNRLATFEPYAYSASIGVSPCNGIVLAKGAPNGCAAQGFAGGVYSKWNNLVPENKHLIAPRLGAAWDVLGRQRWVLRAGVGQFFARDPISPQGTNLLGANPPFTVGVGPERTLDGPTFTSTGPTANMFDFAVGGTPSLGLEQNTNMTNTWQWNLTNELAPFHNAKLELAYVGLRGIHLIEIQNIDQLAPQNRLNWLYRASGDNANNLFPFGGMFANAPARISYWAHRGDSIYHSLQSMFTLRMSHNSIWQTSYTWSKNIGNTEADYTNINTGGIADIYNPRASRGLLDFDRPHVFASSLVYNLPTLEGHSGLLKQVAGGWETSTIISLATGPALTIGGTLNNVTCAVGCGLQTGNTFSGDPWGLGATQYYGTRPLMTGKSCFSGDKLHWLNTAAFTMNGYTLGSPPPGGIGQCHGPGIQDVDFSIDKNWTLHENIKLQFRLESFNLFNHPMFRFGSPGSDSNVTFTGNGGQIVNNVVQGTSLQPGSTFGDTPFSSNLGNREIQYALKLIF